MLYQFLIDNRARILDATREKAIGISQDKPVSAQSERGLPQFYDHLILELKREARGLPKSGGVRKHGAGSTAQHGKELSRLGYTVSQVVHGYGGLCQAITELAETAKTPISAGEFSTLNLNLDVAIADAVTGFTKNEKIEDVDSAKRMGFLVHELRNALAAAIVAHSMVEKGVVGTGGSTNALLKRNLNRMRDILDRSFSEVRMHNEKAVDLQTVRLLEVVEEVEATAGEDARVKGMTIAVEVPAELQVQADRNYLISAVANLVQNGIKYSKSGEVLRVSGRETDESVVLEVEDRCGGLPKGKAAELFKPFIQKGADRSGLGLGLTISRQAVALNGGSLAVRDLPGTGCVFTITLPKARAGRPVAARS
jgi:signal transduction histidine kinase